MSKTWVNPQGLSVFNKIAEEVPTKSIDNALVKMECKEGLVRYKILFAKSKLQLMLAKPQVMTLKGILETSLPLYEGLDDTMKFSTQIGKKSKSNLIPPLGDTKSCLKKSFTKSIAGRLLNPANKLIGSANGIISGGLAFENMIKSNVSDLISNIASSWLTGADSTLFPLLESLEGLLMKTGIGQNIIELKNMKTCMKKTCKYKDDNFPDDSIFYINGTSYIPLTSSGRLNISKFWIYDESGEGLNTPDNRRLLNIVQRRYNKYSKEKSKLVSTHMGTMFSDISDALNSFGISGCGLPEMNKLIDYSNVLFDDVLSSMGGPAASLLSINNPLTNGLKSAKSLLSSSYPQLGEPLKTLDSIYGETEASVTEIYEAAENNVAKANNFLKSSTQLAEEYKAKTLSTIGNITSEVTSITSSITGALSDVISEVSSILPSCDGTSFGTSYGSAASLVNKLK